VKHHNSNPNRILFSQAPKKDKMRNTENGGITTLEFVIDNISVEFRGQ